MDEEARHISHTEERDINTKVYLRVSTEATTSDMWVYVGG
jgi:hypothetical protein